MNPNSITLESVNDCPIIDVWHDNGVLLMRLTDRARALTEIPDAVVVRESLQWSRIAVLDAGGILIEAEDCFDPVGNVKAGLLGRCVRVHLFEKGGELDAGFVGLWEPE